MLKDIKKFRDSEEFKFYEFGDDYYRMNNTQIMKRDPKYFVEGMGIVSNPYKANHRLASGYLPKIIDQKVNYLLGNGAMFTDDTFESDEYGVNFDELLVDLGTTASKKGRSWLYFYLEQSQLRMTEIPPDQIVPIYDEYGVLEKVIRHYDRDKDGKSVKTILVYDSEGVTEYEVQKNKLSQTGVFGHYSVEKGYGGTKVSEEAGSFGRIPFVELRNRPDAVSDLMGIKPLIDIYDIVYSDFANNIDDMQDAYFVIKNFAGDGYAEFLHQLKQTKAVKVGEDGDVTAHQMQIPTEARSTFLELTDKNIFKYAMAVDTTGLTGSSLTNVAIRSQFADLDLKVDRFEGEIRKFIRKFFEFVNSYTGKNYDDEVKFNRALIINDVEMVEAISKSAMVISKKTMLEAHPFVEDVDEELIRLEEEEKLEKFGFGDE